MQEEGAEKLNVFGVTGFSQPCRRAAFHHHDVWVG